MEQNKINYYSITRVDIDTGEVISTDIAKKDYDIINKKFIKYKNYKNGERS